VVTFHLYAHWDSEIPWASHPEFPIFQYGSFGVELFFLISGFVIHLTLENTQNLQTFILKRWLRLFPAMILGSTIVYASSFYLPERPMGALHWADLLLAWVFMDAQIVNQFQTALVFNNVEASFWSLFVEIKFYLLFGFFYFANKETALRNLIGLFLLAFIFKWLAFSPTSLGNFVNFCLFDLLSLQYLGALCVGACLYKLVMSKDPRWGVFSIFLMAPTLLMVFNQTDELIVGFVVYWGFVLTLFNSHIAIFVQNKCWLFLGFISYPLYLIHENALIALTIKTHLYFPQLTDDLTPVPGVLIVLLVSYWIAAYGEPTLRRTLKLLLFSKS
jgi:hypothetical protein